MKIIIKIFMLICVVLAASTIWSGITLNLIGLYGETNALVNILLSVILAMTIPVLFGQEIQQWLWKMSKWIMRNMGTAGSRGKWLKYRYHEYPGLSVTKPSITSLSNLRKIKTPELWVISSGKGGVGKSLLSLGLAERLSARDRVLLVDFDLHNRGLTSLLKIHNDGGYPTAFNLMGEFREMLRNSPDSLPFRNLLESVTTLPQDLGETFFGALSRKFAREKRLDPDNWDSVNFHSLVEPNFATFSSLGYTAPSNNVQIPYASHISFLPSRKQGDSFLLSDQSTSSYIVVALFLQAFCAWIKETTPATIVILDCHGAHDHLTAGAIVAADKLLVVTTTDPGSYDGTAELLDFVSDLRGRDIPTVIALNNCQSWDDRFAGANIEFGELEHHMMLRGVVHLQHISSIREITNNYKFGSVSKHAILWPHICTITDLLKEERKRVKGQDEDTNAFGGKNRNDDVTKHEHGAETDDDS